MNEQRRPPERRLPLSHSNSPAAAHPRRPIAPHAICQSEAAAAAEASRFKRRLEQKSCARQLAGAAATKLAPLFGLKGATANKPSGRLACSRIERIDTKQTT